MWFTLGQVVGGIGLFLIGIQLLQNGFQKAAGTSLRRILAEYTDTTPKGLFSGFIVSSLIQSASAVILTLIGFINARLLKTKQAITVVFGANLGKITIIWLLATFGFKLNVSHYGLHILGIGALIQVLFIKKQSGWTHALMGFGMLLFGLDTLKTSLGASSSFFDWALLQSPGIMGMLLYMFIGTVMSAIMQTSTSAILLTFTLLDAGFISLPNATALVIGQNLGSVTSSIMASLGTTPAAKRLSATHTVFNIVTTIVAFILLSILILYIKNPFIVTHSVMAVTVFYSASIILSLLIMLPLRNKLIRFLKKRFVDTTAMGAPQYIHKDKTVSPDIAYSALKQEVMRFANLCTEVLSIALEWKYHKGWVEGLDLSYEEKEMDRLVDDIHWFAARAARKLSDEKSHIPLYYGFSLASRHFEQASDLSKKITKLKSKFSGKISGDTFDDVVGLTEKLIKLMDILGEAREEENLQALDEVDSLLNKHTEQKFDLRKDLLKAGTDKELAYSDSMILMEIADIAREAVRELYKGTKEVLIVTGKAERLNTQNNVTVLKRD